MAIKARDAADSVDFKDWNDSFNGFKGQTRLFPASTYDFPAAYPFWDRARGFIGIDARQEPLGSFPEGVSMEPSVDGILGEWVGATP